MTAEVRTEVFTGPAALPLLTGLVEGACAAGVVTRERTDEWIAERHARAATDRLFLALPMFLAAATAPR
ncbi:hypothetical protein [Streptomyces spectabilis]|uniref:hypothetical protein n=1 Tax=Streptomyces spectabilis TaxID=68270 RepID=UPI00298F118D|nr:hypothetical protein [Streptomyces spectabilis]